MIGFFDRLLKRLGIVSPIEKDDIINASIEDKAREFDDTVVALRESLHRRREKFAHLRESIQLAKERTHAFEDFEKLTVGRSRSNKGASG